MLKKSLLLLAMAFACLGLSAQSDLSGTVRDAASGEPLMGVSVAIDGKVTTVTNLDGEFRLTDVPKGATIGVSYLGYASQTQRFEGKSPMNFRLEEDSKFLEEAVVVGYGTMKKTDLTGSVGSVSTDKLVMKGTPSLLEAMQGAVAGVNITQSTGRTGGDFNIDIRGRSSINGGTTPLYVVDGVICDDIQWLNQQDIERIDILKDASSTAIYGSRATAGVVMVTTKGAAAQKASKPTISYDGYVGVSQPVRFPDFQNAEEFYLYRLRKFCAFAGTSGATPQPVYTMTAFEQMALETYDGSKQFVLKDMIASGKEVDWPRLITHTGLQQNHYLSVAGGSESVRYHIGVGYNGQKGNYEGDHEGKINFKGSVDARLNKVVTAGFSFNLAQIQNTYASDQGVSNAYNTNAFMLPYFDDGTIIPQPGCRYYIGTERNQFSSGFNPLMYWENEDKARTSWRALGNIYLSLKPLKGLELKTTFSPNYSHYREGYYTKEVSENATRPNKAHLLSGEGLSWTWDNILTYDRDFGRHHHLNLMGLVSAMAGNSQSQRLYYNDVMEGTKWYNLSTGTYDSANSGNSYSESSMLSYALRANYTLLGRYMLTATARWDGSSKFAEGHKWGTFPSVAIAWRLSEENWLASSRDWLSNLKLRAAYGITGNNAGIGNYATLVSIAGPVQYPYGSTYVNGYYPSGIVNRNLQWEKSREINAGLDFGFFKNRISGSIDWYHKVSSDLLFNVQLPLVASGGTMTTNVGSVLNRGIEIALTTVNVATRNWHWETSFSFARNHNEVLDINGLGTDLIPTGLTGGLFIGHPVENVYAYQWDGIVSDRPMTVPNSQLAIDHGFTPGSQVRECDYYFAVYQWNEGQPIIKDVNQDGRFNDEDKRIYSSAPKWTGSFSTTLTYKNWDLSASLYAKVGYYKSSRFYAQYFRMDDRGHMRLNADWYVPAGTLLDCDGVDSDGTLINPVYQETTHYGTYPFPNTGAAENGVGKNGALWSGNANTVVDASFMKVKNITLGYTMPRRVSEKFACQYFRAYLTVTNPFVLTSYRGFDPEWADASLSYDGPSNVTYQVGLSLKF